MIKFAEWRTIADGEATTKSWYYGLAKYDFEQDRHLVMIIPFNFIYNIFYRLYILVRFSFSSNTRHIEYKYRLRHYFKLGYEDGFKAGFEAGREDVV